MHFAGENGPTGAIAGGVAAGAALLFAAPALAFAWWKRRKPHERFFDVPGYSCTFYLILSIDCIGTFFFNNFIAVHLSRGESRSAPRSTEEVFLARITSCDRWI